jgi:DNA-binding response OmpR family regulator
MYPILTALKENAAMAEIDFDYQLDTPKREVVLDIEQTEGVILNLFSNAVKYTKPGGKIAIETGFCMLENSELLCVEVCDNGIGISADKMDKIFDRFYRVEEQNDVAGTGIGLALCKSLVDLMKGKITVESIPNVKTTFKVYLPFQHDQVDDVVSNHRIEQRTIVTDWISSETDEDQTDQSFEAARYTLLIIDDESDVRTFLFEAFSPQYNVVLASNGEEGLKQLKEYHPFLVICDVMMPVLSGYEVCKKIKSDPDTCHIPVILLTAVDDDIKKIDAFELGADDYITKPFSIRLLKLRVKSLIVNKKRIIEYFSGSSVIPDDFSMPAKDRQFLKKLNLIIDENMSDSRFGVEELAKKVNMSPSWFLSKIKQITGQVPNTYLRNYRLQKAADLLRANKNLTALEVMSVIGIETASHFSTAFKKLHGVSPSEFVKNL